MAVASCPHNQSKTSSKWVLSPQEALCAGRGGTAVFWDTIGQLCTPRQAWKEGDCDDPRNQKWRPAELLHTPSRPCPRQPDGDSDAKVGSLGFSQADLNSNLPSSA